MKKPCLNPKCRNKADTRGLCGTCYTDFRKLVQSGKTTWGDLEAKGHALPPARRPSTAMDWLRESKNKKDGR